MPKTSLKKQRPKTPLARLRKEFLFREDGKRFYQKDLANDLEISTARVQQLELGQEPLPEKHALKLQEIYGISADWLLVGKSKAPPVCPNGQPYARSIATHARMHHLVRFSDARKPSANLAWQLAISLEALLSETRSAVIRTCHEKGLHEAAALFSSIRDSLIPDLSKGLDSTTRSVSSALQKEAAWINASTDEYIQRRLELTRSRLGANDLPILDHKGKEILMPA